jgi:hypothetical protein
MGGTYIANVDDVRPQFMTDDNVFLSQNAIFNSTLVRTNGVDVGATIDQFSGQRLDEVSGFKTEALPSYSDQILPFDITLAGTNENGAATCMKIFGVEILNEGSGVSIDDAVTEMQATFVARYVFRPSSSRRKVNSPRVGGDAGPAVGKELCSRLACRSEWLMGSAGGTRMGSPRLPDTRPLRVRNGG